jgi:hypothetical protein
MINVNQITSRLASMADRALQQYAAMHKNDPYTMALALAESNRRKQMRQGAQMQAPQQPKVVDQEIAGMAAVDPMGNVTGYAGGGYLPEDTGIGQLPAPNMQSMAEGGIVAFDEGGEVPGYAEGVYTGRPTGGLLGDIPGYVPGATSFGLPQPGVEDPNSLTTLEKLKRWNERGIAERKLKEVNAARAQAGLPPVAQIDSPLTPPAPAAPAAVVAPPAAPKVTFGGTSKRSASPLAALVEPPAPAAPAAKPVAGLPSLSTAAPTAAQAKADAAALVDDAELRRSLENNEKFTTQAYEKLLGDYNKKVAELPEAYKGYEERLKKEEEAASNDKDKALGMAIFQAGLGMMAGTSQYAFENIGKGALAGLDNYQSALKDLKKAQRERDKAFADIEAARLAEKRGDLKASTELQAKGIEALGTAKNRTVDGIAKIFQVNTETAKGIFDTGLKDKAQNERTIYTTAAEMQKQSMADAAAMARINAQVKGQKEIAQISTDAYKLPMLYKSVEDSVDKMLQADTNYRAADEMTKTRMRDEALRKRLLTTPGLAQYAPAASGGGGGGLRYNEQTGKIE